MKEIALVLDGIGFDHLKTRRAPTPRPGPCAGIEANDADSPSLRSSVSRAPLYLIAPTTSPRLI